MQPNFSVSLTILFMPIVMLTGHQILMIEGPHQVHQSSKGPIWSLGGPKSNQ